RSSDSMILLMARTAGGRRGMVAKGGKRRAGRTSGAIPTNFAASADLQLDTAFALRARPCPAQSGTLGRVPAVRKPIAPEIAALCGLTLVDDERENRAAGEELLGAAQVDAGRAAAARRRGRGQGKPIRFGGQ